MIQYKEMQCKVALNELKRKIPYGWDLNIYRGCEHGCKYCYAIYSNAYLENGSFFDSIYVKTDIVEALERALNHPSWKREVINIGGVTDSYQPAERKYKLMPEILKLLIKYKTPAIISTKSDLVLRDYDLIDELSRITYINVAATITSMDEKVRTLLEPNGVTSAKRFEMLAEFRKTNASVGLHLMPIVPYLTDGYENLNEIFSCAKQANVHYVLPGTLYLRGGTRPVFFQFVQEYFPSLYAPLMALYKKGGADLLYKDALYKVVNSLREKYQLKDGYSKPMKEKMHPKDVQLSLF